ncbi:hypothetical protein B0H12DRAFT_1153297 [Mycena haematopus]|nr:hypothetical protein B0H12DRAFT_1153297 [Mycena haematopus]
MVSFLLLPFFPDSSPATSFRTPHPQALGSSASTGSATVAPPTSTGLIQPRLIHVRASGSPGRIPYTLNPLSSPDGFSITYGGRRTRNNFSNTYSSIVSLLRARPHHLVPLALCDRRTPHRSLRTTSRQAAHLALAPPPACLPPPRPRPRPPQTPAPAPATRTATSPSRAPSCLRADDAAEWVVSPLGGEHLGLVDQRVFITSARPPPANHYKSTIRRRRRRKAWARRASRLGLDADHSTDKVWLMGSASQLLPRITITTRTAHAAHNVKTAPDAGDGEPDDDGGGATSHWLRSSTVHPRDLVSHHILERALSVAPRPPAARLSYR